MLTAAQQEIQNLTPVLAEQLGKAPFVRSRGRREDRHNALARVLKWARAMEPSLEKLEGLLPHVHPAFVQQVQPVRTIYYVLRWAYLQLQKIKMVSKLLPFSKSHIRELDRLLSVFGALVETLTLYLLPADQESKEIQSYELGQLEGRELLLPFTVSLEPDDDGFLAKCFEVPQVYGFGETRNEALSMLERELVSLNRDLQEDDAFAPEFLSLKKMFQVAGIS